MVGISDCLPQLEAQKADIEKELAQTLTWYNPPDARVCRIFLRHDADLEDRTQWDGYHEWLRSSLEALHRVFSQRVRRLAGPVDTGPEVA